MTTTIIHIDMDAVDERLQHGKLWAKHWGDYTSADGETCLHGAIRYCQPVPGDARIIEQVGAKYGFGTSANDECDSWACIFEKVIPDITDEMLADTFGPQWEPIVALVRRSATLTVDEIKQLGAAWGAARDAAWGAARDAAWGAARDAARDAARGAAWGAARDAALGAAWDAALGAAWGAALDAARDAAEDAARDAALVLVARDLIGQDGFTQAHYDTMTTPWATVIGKVHPDDADRMVAS